MIEISGLEFITIGAAAPAEASGKKADSVQQGIHEQQIQLIAGLNESRPHPHIGCRELLVPLALEKVHKPFLHRQSRSSKFCTDRASLQEFPAPCSFDRNCFLKPTNPNPASDLHSDVQDAMWRFCFGLYMGALESLYYTCA